ncbi:sugar transferase [Nitrospira sp. Nam80]
MEIMTQLDRGLPFASVIIPCRNEEALIEQCLDSIVKNDYPAERVEIIVVDGMSEDRTRAIVDEYAKRCPRLRLVNNPAGTIPAAMNLGIKESGGQFILKMDAHSTYPPSYIRDCIRYLIGYQADMAGGIWSIAPRKNTLRAQSIAAALSHWFASGNAYIKTGSGEPRWADAAAFGCWTREALEKLGPFDERLAGSSDMDLNIRLRKSGGKILLAPQIQITYFADSDLGRFWQHNFSDGVWATYPLKFGKLAGSWRHMVPLLFVLTLLGWIPALFFFPPVGRLLTWTTIAYGGVNLAAAAQLCVRTGNWKYIAVIPIVFAIRHVAHGLGALYGGLLVPLPGMTWKGRRAGARNANKGYAGRRAFDIVGSAVGLILCLPLMVALSLLVKLDSRGPVFYRGERLGRHGKPFHILKFRTMRRDSERAGPPITPNGDRRVTRIGAVLRKFKLDELPQLINVLKGEMSLVGPRPETAFYFQFYTTEEKDEILSVRPGMTDYGSLRFHNESELLAGDADPVKAYVERIRDEKVREQRRYIREQSLCTDLKLILMTLAIIVATRFGRGRLTDSPVSHET